MKRTLRGAAAAGCAAALVGAGLVATGQGAASSPAPPTQLLFGAESAAPLTAGDGKVFVTDIARTGRATGSGVITAGRSGRTLIRTPFTNGQISTAIADGKGGWYIGGTFTTAGGRRQRYLARVDADGRADRTFRPAVNGLVDALALRGGRLYAGGGFTRVQGHELHGLVALNPRTGRELPAFNAPAPVGFVPELSADAGALYVAANNVHGHNRFFKPDQLLALDLRTGRPLSGFTPTLPSERISALAEIGGTLFVGAGGPGGGSGSVTALDPRSGAVKPGFHSPVSGAVDDLIANRGRLLIAGDFGRAASGMLAADPRSGMVDRSFACHFGGQVYSVAASGGRLWLGGQVPAADAGPDTGGLTAAVNPRTCAADGPALHPDGPVNAIARSGGRLLTGGQFTTTHTTSGNVAVYSARTGRYVRTLDFASVPGEPYDSVTPISTAFADGRVWLLYERQLVAFDPHDGHILLDRRIPLVTFAQVDEPPARPALTAYGGRLYLLTASHRVKVFDARTGRLDKGFHMPLHGITNSVSAGDGAIYLAGSYKRTRADGQHANIALIRADPATGRLDGAFDPHLNGPALSVIVRPAGVYVDGLFTRAATAVRHGLGAVDPRTGAVRRAFAPIPPGTGRLRTLHSSIVLLGDRIVYLAGDTPYSGDVAETVFDATTGAKRPGGLRAFLAAPLQIGTRVFAIQAAPSSLITSPYDDLDTAGYLSLQR